MKTTSQIQQRLDYLRGELRAERISLGEIAELQDLAPFISREDVELLEAAGVPEFPEPPARAAAATNEMSMKHQHKPLVTVTQRDLARNALVDLKVILTAIAEHPQAPRSPDSGLVKLARKGAAIADKTLNEIIR